MTFNHINNEFKILGISIISGILVSACSQKSGDEAIPGALAQIGSHAVTLTEVIKEMPGGLSESDSTRFVRAYVNNWIEDHLLSEVAPDEVDMNEIDRLTSEYRNRLIFQEYRRKMFETHAAEIPDDSVKAYYETHKNDLVLERPMVHGIYLKVPDDAKNLKTIKKLYKSKKQADLDKLEKEVLSSAIHYDYFYDRWVDWEQIELRIPYDFDAQGGSKWLEKNKTLEFSAGGFTYLLNLTETLAKGSPMPLEAAKPQILDQILRINRQTYDARLMKELYNSAIESGRLKVNL